MKILVVGTGGNGQTYFMEYLLQKSFKLNDIGDKDKLKHISCPSKLSSENKKCKIIYVYNNIFDSICSHYRRKWAILQMNKIKNKKNTCKINNIENFLKLTEKDLSDHFGIENHFLRWYKYDFPNGIYYLNLNKINKYELSSYLKCNVSIFDNLIYDSTKRHNYDNLKSKFPLTNIMYSNIDNYIHKLCVYRNSKEEFKKMVHIN